MSLNDISLEDTSNLDPAILNAMQNEGKGNLPPEEDQEIFGESVEMLVAVQESIGNLQERREVQKEVSNSGVICRYQAEVVQECFGGLIGSKLSLEEFTLVPTKTNFNYTANYMRTSIEEISQAIVSSWAQFVEPTLGKLDTFGCFIKDSVIPFVNSKCSEVQNSFQDTATKLATSKDTKYSTAEGVVCIKYTPISKINFTSFDNKGIGNDRLNDLKSVLLQALVIPGVLNTINDVLKCNGVLSVNDDIFNRVVFQTQIEEITFDEVAKFITSIATSEYLAYHAAKMSELSVKITEAIQQVDGSVDKIEANCAEIYHLQILAGKYHQYFIAMERIFSTTQELLRFI